MRKSSSNTNTLLRKLITDIRRPITIPRTNELSITFTILRLHVLNPLRHERMREFLMFGEPAREIEVWVIVGVAEVLLVFIDGILTNMLAIRPHIWICGSRTYTPEIIRPKNEIPSISPAIHHQLCIIEETEDVWEI